MQDDQTPSMFTRVSQWLKPKKASAEETPNTSGAAAQPEAHTAMPTEKTAPKTPPSGNEPPQAEDAQQPPSKSSRSRRSSRRGGRSRRGKGKSAEQATSMTATEAAEATSEETRLSPASSGKGGCKLLINTDEPEECRLALVENGKVESFHIETVSQALAKGNIYKGRITAVEANLQAAFVDIGHVKNGFLPFSDIHPEYYAVDVSPDTHWKDLRIQDVVKKGQEVLVEVVKEATGNKGAMLTTYLSLPGRYLVLMPGSDSAGISRKIDNEAERRQLREMMESLKIPEGIGYIVRTASQEITKTGLAQDLRYLLNLWEEIKKRGQTQPAPSLVYKEQNIISRFLRDHYTTEIREILVDNPEALEQVKAFLQLLPPTQRDKTSVRLHHGAQPLFHQYHVEKQVEQMFQPTVPLPSGGSIVINPTEALVAIDVNSGRTSKDKDFEESIFLANMEAAEELARQLRMRDLGGLIVVDFIDMREAKHIREVEKKVRECMKRDKAKVDFSKISKFGLMQISRQKMAAPIHTGAYKTCPHCEGRGVIRSVEALALMHLRQIQTGMSRRQAKKVLCRLPMEVAQYILNKKRADLVELENRHQAEIVIEADPTMTPAASSIEFIKGD
ncbi:MAG: Rne/Rng family ribonuclease [Thermodesulfobacteriota bacterium]